MFYCVGENHDSSRAVGRGETMEQAIRNWASGSGDDVFDEFDRWNPDTFIGQPINVTVKKEFIISQ